MGFFRSSKPKPNTQETLLATGGETEEDTEFDLMFSETGAASGAVPDTKLDLAGLLGGGMGAQVSTEMDDAMAILNGLDILGSGSVE